MEYKSKQLNVRVGEKLLEKFKESCLKAERSPSETIRNLIEKFIKEE